MRSFICTLALSLGLALSAPGTAWSRPPLSPEAEESAQARSSFRQGVAALKDGKFAEARAALLDAWALRRTYDVAALLGQTELALKLHVEAATHLDFALKNLAPRESADTFAQIQSGLQEALQHVAELRISVDEAGAQIFVDGALLGTAPLPRPVFVAPGLHGVEARVDSSRFVARAVEAERATAYGIELSLPPPSAARPGSVPRELTAFRPARPPEAPSLTPVFVGFGVTVAAAAFGVGYRFAQGDTQRNLEMLQRRNAGGCDTGDAAPWDCSAERERAQSLDSQRTLATASFIAAGAAALATGAYWFWPREAKATGAATSRVRAFAAPTPSGGALLLSGAF